MGANPSRPVRVVVHPADQGGCGFYRLLAPCAALEANPAAGVEVSVNFDASYEAVWRDNVPVELVKRPDADVVVLQRPLMRETALLVRLLREAGVEVVVEIDDAFWCIHRENAAWRSCDPQHSPNRNWRWMEQAVSDASLVTVTTERLAEHYGRRTKAVILPNYVPEPFLSIERAAHDGVWVGWSGAIISHPTDLQVTGGGVARAVVDTGARFGVVGTGAGVAARLGLPEGVEMRASGWQPLDRYPVALAQLDVGIVPLELSTFNDAKSWLKGVEMAAVGVPFVASPTAEYRRLAAVGIGRLARTPEDWFRAVRHLVSHPKDRERVAVEQRVQVREARLTVEQNAHRWAEAWASLLVPARRGLAC